MYIDKGPFQFHIEIVKNFFEFFMFLCFFLFFFFGKEKKIPPRTEFLLRRKRRKKGKVSNRARDAGGFCHMTAQMPRSGEGCLGSRGRPRVGC